MNWRIGQSLSFESIFSPESYCCNRESSKKLSRLSTRPRRSNNTRWTNTRNKFDGLKTALSTVGFDVSLVAFRENEEKEWDIREIVQRMACFLKDRWKFIQPTSIYKSKGKGTRSFYQ